MAEILIYNKLKTLLNILKLDCGIQLQLNS